MTEYRSGDAYLQIVPGRYSCDLKVVNATQRKPSVVDPDAVVVKLRIRVPTAAFEPLRPEAEVTIPDRLVQHLVQVEAEEPCG